MSLCALSRSKGEPTAPVSLGWRCPVLAKSKAAAFDADSRAALAIHSSAALLHQAGSRPAAGTRDADSQAGCRISLQVGSMFTVRLGLGQADWALRHRDLVAFDDVGEEAGHRSHLWYPVQQVHCSILLVAPPPQPQILCEAG